MRVHYIEGENTLIAFFPETKKIFRINEKAKELIECLDENLPKSEILERFEISDEQYNIYMEKAFPHYCYNISENIEQDDQSNILPRLVIHLTNDCNMRCQYCYANGGHYLSSRAVLDKAVLDKIIEVFYQKYDQILSIQFFGGEPLMNMPILEYACEKIALLSNGRGYETLFGIVTNATLINDKFINLVNKYHIHVTVSYDGNPAINDIMRCMSDGSGSTSIIFENAKKLKAETGQPETIEVTYNNYHIINSISILDVIKHIHAEFPNTNIHLVPAGGDDNCDYAIKDLSVFRDSIHEIIEWNKVRSLDEQLTYSLEQRIFYALNNKKHRAPLICDAGIGTISVSVTGDVYPCFMFTDNRNMCYGSVFDRDLFVSHRYNMLNSQLATFSIKDNNYDCNNCFIKNLCNGCLGLNSFHSGTPFELSKPLCDMFRGMTEQVIIELVNMQSKTC